MDWPNPLYPSDEANEQNREALRQFMEKSVTPQLSPNLSRIKELLELALIQIENDPVEAENLLHEALKLI